MTFIVTLLALAAIGAATLFLGFGLLVIYGLTQMVRRVCRLGRAWKVKRELRGLEVGTCDGLKAWQIEDVIEEYWLEKR